METSLKTGFAQIFSCCPKNLSCPKFGGAAAPLAPPARTPMLISQVNFKATEPANMVRLNLRNLTILNLQAKLLEMSMGLIGVVTNL